MGSSFARDMGYRSSKGRGCHTWPSWRLSQCRTLIPSKPGALRCSYLYVRCRLYGRPRLAAGDTVDYKQLQMRIAGHRPF